jgi:formylglycine-generating enzyme required for sulfatase activity
MKTVFTSLLSLLTAMTMNAQVINGDLNHNDNLDVEDVTLLIDGYLTGETEVIETSSNYYKEDNSLIVGTWYTSKTNSIVFEADNTYGGGFPYKFIPAQGEILLFDNYGNVVDDFRVIYLTDEVMVVKLNDGTYLKMTRTIPPQWVTSITLSATELWLKPDGYEKLTATVLPTDADNPSVEWISSDETVVIVSQKGMVEAVGEGTATITCMAADGSGVKATCEVTVSNQPSKTTTYTVNDVSFKMVSVIGGTFLMGAQKTNSGGANYDEDADDDEAPVHNVTLSNYYIGETEVTQALWVAVMGCNPSTSGDNMNQPVETVSWDDCQEFIKNLNQLTGEKFRLPTEAEWEFAARGGTKSQGYKYSGSNTIDDVAWYRDNSDGETYEVATKQPNELGLYDMNGNVWEWCQDWYGDYLSSAQSNPTGPATGYLRVRRGGSSSSKAAYCRAAGRGGDTPVSCTNILGLRLALSSSTTR